MILTANIWHTYFYIFCKWFVIFYFVFCAKEIVVALIDLIRMSMIQKGPCKALVKLEERLAKLERGDNE